MSKTEKVVTQNKATRRHSVNKARHNFFIRYFFLFINRRSNSVGFSRPQNVSLKFMAADSSGNSLLLIVVTFYDIY